MPGLADIPFYGAYVQRRQMNEQAPMQELQQASGAMGLVDAMRKQQQEHGFRDAVGALGPNPTQEALAGVAAKYGSPDKVMDVQQKSLDRQDAAKERALQFAQTIQLRQDALDQKKSEFDQRAQDTAARAQFDQWYKGQTLVLQQQQAAVSNELRRLGLDIQQQGIDARRDALANKPLTEGQGKSATYGSRAAQSDKVLQGLEDKISLPGLAAGRSIPGGNYFLSSEQQRVDQAQRDFVNAVLRQESGAAISASEFDNAQKQYFPQPGDEKVTIDQKRANRQLVIDGFKRQSGSAGADIEAIRGSPLLPGAGPAKVANDADYEKLPKGAMFIGPDAKTRKKP